jgi:hypothetical protein
MKKTVAAGAMLLILTCGLALAGCGSSSTTTTTPTSVVSTGTIVPEGELVGTWMSQKAPADTMTIRANDTFDLTKSGTTTTGSYVVKSNQLMLSAGSFTDFFKIGADGKTLTEADGTVWVKK